MSRESITVKAQGGLHVRVSKDEDSTIISLFKKGRRTFDYDVEVACGVSIERDQAPVSHRIERDGYHGKWTLSVNGLYVYLPDASARAVAEFLGIQFE